MKNNSKYSLVTLLLFIMATLTVNATDFTVNSLADTNTGASTSGTLRWCINQVNTLGAGPHTITFDTALSGGTITLSSNLPVVSVSNVTIDGIGDGSGNIIIDADGGDITRYIFRADANGDFVTFRNFILQNTGYEPFRFDGSPTDITIENIVALHTGGNYFNYGINFQGSASNLTVLNFKMTQKQNYAEAAIYISGTANDVLIDNFDLSESAGGSIEAIRFRGAANNITIQNCNIDLDLSANGNDGDYGIRFLATASNITLNNNIFTNIDNYSLFFNSTTSNINVSDYEFVNGGGGTTTFGMRFVGAASTINMTNITLDLDHSDTTDDGDYGIFFDSTTSNVTLDNITMHDAERYGLYFGGVATDFEISNSTFDNFDGWTSNVMIQFNSVINGLIMTNVDIDLNLTDNGTSLDDGNYGIYFNTHLNQDLSKNALLTNVTINQADSQGIYTRSQVNNLTIEGCFFTGNLETNTTNYGIEFDNNAQKSNITINNSTFTNLGSAAILIDMDGTDSTSNNKITNNSISGIVAASYPGYGIWLWNRNGTTDLEISGNEIFNNASNGIQIESVDGVDISENSIYNNVQGINNVANSGNNDLEQADGDTPVILNSVNTGVDTYDVTFTTPPIAVCNPCEIEFFTNTASDAFDNGRTYVQTETGLTGGTTYTKSINSGGENSGFWTTTLKSNNLNNSVSEFGYAHAISPVGPGGVTTGLDFWFDPSVNLVISGSSVTQWSDRAFSGNNPVLGQATASLYPTFNSGTAASNFNPYVDFTGNTRLHQTVTGSNYASSHSIFAAYRNNQASPGSIYAHFLRFSSASNSNGGSHRWGFGYNTYPGSNSLAIHYISAPFAAGSITLPLDQYNQYNVSKPWATGTTGIVSATINQAGSQTIMGFDGNESINNLVINNGNLSVNNHLTLGGGSTYGQAGWGQEIIEYSVALSQIDREKVNSYLAIKYGITLSHDYLASDNSPVWSLGSGYDNDIAGIARDDNGVLNQKQSKSVNADAIVTIGLGSIETTNANNSNTFIADKDFLVWGNDDASTDFQTTELPATAIAKHRLGRQWKVSETGSVSNLTISFSGVGISPSAHDYELYIDTDGDGNFANATVITGGAMLDGTVTFTGVDLNDGDVFTLGLTNPAPGGVITDLEFWVKANAGIINTTDGANVPTWAGQSPNSNSFYDANEGGPTYSITRAINFNPVLEWSGAGSQEMRSVNGFLPQGSITEFAVASWDILSNAGDIVIDHGISGQDNEPAFMFDNSTIRLWDESRNDNLYHNQNVIANIPVVMDHAFTHGINGMNVGMNGSEVSNNQRVDMYDNSIVGLGNGPGTADTNILDGLITESIGYSRELTLVEKQKIRTYLSIKYGVTLEDNYYASDWNGTTGTTLWTLGGSYDNDIAGIGRDDLSALNQKQSRSVNTDAIVTIGLGSIETTNTDNTNTYTADKDFLVWGNDDASTAVVNTGIPSAFSEKIARNWLVNETGVIGNTLVQIPNGAVAGFSNTTELVLFVADDNGFTTNLVTIPLVQNGANWEATIDFDGIKYFTFGIVAPSDFMRHGKTFQGGEEQPMKF